MLRLFHIDIDTTTLSTPLQLLLKAVEALQLYELSIMNFNINKTGITAEEETTLIKHIYDVADKLNLHQIDWSQRILMREFNNTPLDILVHSIFDNHRLAQDPRTRNVVLMWERHVISPVVRHLGAIKRLDVLNNSTLVGDAKIMDTWSKFDGTNERGMFNTIGSMLAKGYFKALVSACETPYLPSSFVGNLVAWGLHASDPETRDDIYVLLSVIHSLDHYKPSSGVVEKILSYEPGIKRPTIDIISDFQYYRYADLRDIDVPNDTAWQITLLNLAKQLIINKCINN
jgi:hypothetical protein